MTALFPDNSVEVHFLKDIVSADDLSIAKI